MRCLAVLMLLIIGCGSEPSSSGTRKQDPDDSTTCDEMDVVMEGLGSVPRLAWMKSAEAHAHAVAVDADGNVFVAGEVVFGVDLGGGTLTGEPGTSFSNDAFLVSYTARGDHRWSKRFGG